MKSLKQNLSPIILITFFLPFVYWLAVVSISSEQMKKGNDYGMKALIHQSKEILILIQTGVDNHTVSDKFNSRKNEWYEKSEKTIKLIPSFLRP